MEKNKEVVLRFIEAMNSGDAEVADTCLSPDAITVAKGHGKFAGIRDRDTIIGTLSTLKQVLPEGMGFEVKNVIAESDTVVVEFEGNAPTSNGRIYHNQYCMIFLVENNRIKQVNEYFCTAHADDVLWPYFDTEG